MAEYKYVVSFHGPLTDETRAALDDADDLELSGRTGGATVASGGRLPDPNRTWVHLTAPDDIAAVARVEGLVLPTGVYGEFSVGPG